MRSKVSQLILSTSALGILNIIYSVAGQNCDVENEPPPGCNVNNPDPETSGCFTQQAEGIGGIKQWAQADVPQWAFDYNLSLLNEYLDSNEDGVADDPNLIAALTNDERTKDVALLTCRGGIGSGPLKDSFWSVTRTYGATSLEDVDDNGLNGFKRNAMEEQHHVIHRGLEKAYPQIFGNGLNTELSRGIDEAYDNCEYVASCVPNCQHYTCVCENPPCDDVGQYNCRWIEGSCDGIYHYDHPMGCDCATEGGGCQGSEGFYWPWTTAYGWQANACDQIAGEWEVCTPEQFATNPKTAILYKLVTGQSPSQAIYGYRLPSRLPDGKYMQRDLTCGMYRDKAACMILKECRWTDLNLCSNCIDSPLRFLINGRKRKCSWVKNNTMNRCSKPGIATHCRETCGTCAGECTNSMKKWQLKNGKNRRCKWVAKKFDKRCQKPGVKQTCPMTCKQCS
mmetsp:Transcript_654/g.712  ORF Transcript_654/g.712 Transcript_654/m.712 type:complete len:452 (+) Transcript_654:38-1393(+)